MTDRKALSDANEPPEDVASLYSWANLHGAKYRDFSAARAQTREKARQRVQQVIDEERERARQQTEAQQADPAKRTAKPPLTEEQAHLAELATQLAAQLAAHQASQSNSEKNSYSHTSQSLNVPPASSWRSTGSQGPSPSDSYPSVSPHSTIPPAFVSRGVAGHNATREELPASRLNDSWAGREPREKPSRPAWLSEAPEGVRPSTASQPPNDTIQGSRERLTTRWFALKGLLEGEPAVSLPEAVQPPSSSRTPALAVFSLAGGVGKTSLVATLGRALSSRGERVLLVDTATFGLLPFFFGARDQRLNELRTFTPPSTSGDSPVQMITLDPESLGADNGTQDNLAGEISRHSRGVSRILIDLATASGATTRRVLKLSPLVLVPVIPDMNSVVSVGSIDEFFEHHAGAAGKLPYYALNQFDSSLPLHLDVREVLREQLGDRLLPFVLRRSPSVSEALAEGMTVMDYAPNSTIAEDFGSLVGWVKSLSAPASTGFRGVRWSER